MVRGPNTSLPTELDVQVPKLFPGQPRWKGSYSEAVGGGSQTAPGQTGPEEGDKHPNIFSGTGSLGTWPVHREWELLFPRRSGSCCSHGGVVKSWDSGAGRCQAVC